MLACTRVIFIVGLLVASQGYVSAESEVIELEDRATPIVDAFFILRTIIQTAINNLQNAANIGNQLLNNLATAIQQQQSAFLQNLNNSLVIVNQNIQNVVNQILNSGQTIAASTVACVNQQSTIAQQRINQTVNEIITCVNTAATGIQNVLTSGRNLAQSASALATDIGNQVQACGVANFGNWLQVSNCLNGIWANSQTQINSFMGQLASTNANTLIVISTVPINLAICGGSSILNTASVIIAGIAQCSSQAISQG